MRSNGNSREERVRLKKFQQEYVKSIKALLDEIDAISKNDKLKVSSRAQFLIRALGTASTAASVGGAASGDPIAGTVAGFFGMLVNIGVVSIAINSEDNNQRKAQDQSNNLDLSADINSLESLRLNLVLEEVAFELSNIWEYQIFQVQGNVEIARIAKDAAFRSLCYVAQDPNNCRNEIAFRNSLIKGVLEGVSDDDLRSNQKKTRTTQEDVEFRTGNLYVKPGIKYKDHYFLSAESHHIKKYGSRKPLEALGDGVFETEVELTEVPDSYKYYHLERMASAAKIFGMDGRVEHVVQATDAELAEYIASDSKAVTSFNSFIKKRRGNNASVIALYISPEHYPEIDIEGGDFSGSVFFNCQFKQIVGDKPVIADAEFYYCNLDGLNITESERSGAHIYSYEYINIEVGIDDIREYMLALPDISECAPIIRFNDYIAEKYNCEGQNIVAVYRPRQGDGEMVSMSGGNFAESVFFDLNISKQIVGIDEDIPQRKTIFAGAKLFRLQADNAKLINVDFSCAIMPVANLDNAEIKGKSNLVRTEMQSSSMRGFTLRASVVLEQTDISYSNIDDGTFPEGVDDYRKVISQGCKKTSAKIWPEFATNIGEVILPGDLKDVGVKLIGRQTYLEDIEQSFRANQFTVLTGSAGIGVSSVAIKYAAHFCSEVQDGQSFVILYIDAKDPKDSIDSDFRKLAYELRRAHYWDDNVGISDDVAAQDVIRSAVYEKLNELNSLVIIDGIDLESVKKYLPEKSAKNVKMLLTSSHDLMDGENIDRGDVEVVAVQEFEAKESILYLLGDSHDLADEDSINIYLSTRLTRVYQSGHSTPYASGRSTPRHELGEGVDSTSRGGGAPPVIDNSTFSPLINIIALPRDSFVLPKEKMALYASCIEVADKLGHHPLLMFYIRSEIERNRGQREAIDILSKYKDIQDYQNVSARFTDLVRDIRSNSEIKYKVLMRMLMLNNRGITKSDIASLSNDAFSVDELVQDLQMSSLLILTQHEGVYMIHDAVQKVLLKGLKENSYALVKRKNKMFSDYWNDTINRALDPGGNLGHHHRYAIISKYEYLDNSRRNEVMLSKEFMQLYGVIFEIDISDKKALLLYAILNHHPDFTRSLSEGIDAKELTNKFLEQVVEYEIIAGKIKVSKYLMGRVDKGRRETLLKKLDDFADIFLPDQPVREYVQVGSESRVSNVAKQRPSPNKPRTWKISSLFSQVSDARVIPVNLDCKPVEERDIVDMAIRISERRKDVIVLEKLCESDVVSKNVFYEVLFKYRIFIIQNNQADQFRGISGYIDNELNHIKDEVGLLREVLSSATLGQDNLEVLHQWPALLDVIIPDRDGLSVEELEASLKAYIRTDDISAKQGLAATFSFSSNVSSSTTLMSKTLTR